VRAYAVCGCALFVATHANNTHQHTQTHKQVRSKYPNFSSLACYVGASIPTEHASTTGRRLGSVGTMGRLQGQMGAFYLFSKDLSPEQMRGIYQLGPAYMYRFESARVDFRKVSSDSFSKSPSTPRPAGGGGGGGGVVRTRARSRSAGGSVDAMGGEAMVQEAMLRAKVRQGYAHESRSKAGGKGVGTGVGGQGKPGKGKSKSKKSGGRSGKRGHSRSREGDGASGDDSGDDGIAHSGSLHVKPQHHRHHQGRSPQLEAEVAQGRRDMQACLCGKVTPHILITFNPAVKGAVQGHDLFLDNSPHRRSAAGRSQVEGVHALAFPGTCACVTRRARDIMDCLGGVMVLFPLFRRLDKLLSMDSHRPLVGDEPELHSDQVQPNDMRYVESILDLMNTMLVGSKTNRHIMREYNGYVGNGHVCGVCLCVCVCVCVWCVCVCMCVCVWVGGWVLVCSYAYMCFFCSGCCGCLCFVLVLSMSCVT